MKNILLIIGLLLLINISKAQVSFYADVTSGCAPLTVNFTNNSSIDTTGLTFLWSYNYGEDLIFSYDFNHTFEFANSYYVFLLAVDSVGNHVGSYAMYIDVQGNRGEFYTNMGEHVCPGTSIYFYSNSNYWNQTWDMGDGTIYENTGNVNHVYTSPGTYIVTFYGEGDCGIDTITQNFYVDESAIPTVSASIDGGDHFCPNDPVVFRNNYNATSYLWNFGDGQFSIESQPVHSYTNTGDYDVILKATNSCGNSNWDTVTVHIDNSTGANSWINLWPNNVCPNSEIYFVTSSSGSLLWDLGDGTTSTERELYHSYADTGNYQISLIVNNSCGYADTSYQTVYVQYQPDNKPNAQISFNDFNNWDNFGNPINTVTVCPNTEVQFRNNSWSSSEIESYFWSFGDGNNASTENASHIFTNLGINEVMLIVTTSCGSKDTAYKWVNVDNSIMPTSDLQFIPSVICPNEKVFFYDQNFEGEYTYNVWFGDGESDLGITEPDSIIGILSAHTYTSVGTYNFTFTATNSCGNTDTLQGTITVDNSGTSEPFYYVINSTVNENGGNALEQFTDFSVSTTGTEHEFTIPATFSQWIPGVSDTLVYVFWYGGFQNFNGENPAGIVVADNLGTGVAYVPVNGNDSVVVAAVWWCSGEINGDPQAMGFAGAFALTEGGQTTTSTIDVSGWDGECVPNYNPEAGCPGDNVAFVALGGVDYEWHLTDGTIVNSSTASANYPNEGLFDSYVIITNGCGENDTIHSLVEIGNYNVPESYFYYNTNGSGWSCTYEPIYFYSQEENDMGNYAYLWDFGDGTFSTEESPIHEYTYGGEFDVILTVTNGCGSNSDTNTVWISQPEVTSTVFNGCSGENNGSISIQVNNGWWPMSYEWSTGDNYTSINNLAPGNYSVTVTDNGGCQYINLFEVAQPDSINITLNVNHISCFGNTDGSIETVITGGTEPYYYFWNTSENSATINNLSAGIYALTLSDNNGCTSNNSAEILEPAILSSSIIGYDQTCYDISDGNADLTVTGGTTPYSYNWDGGYTIEDPTDMSEGTYYVTVTDINGCFTFDSVSISRPTDIILSHTLVNASCGANDGSIDISVSGGVTPYLYNWSNGETTEDLSNLSANFYTLTISDDNGCSKENTYSIENPGAPIITVDNTTSVTCNGDADGAINISISGGTTPYTILWNIGSTSLGISNLSGGNYSVTVTDAGSCVVVNPEINVYEPEILTISSEITNVTCKNYGDGSILAIPSGGNGGFSYAWSNLETTDLVESLIPGNYSVTVTDTYGCSESLQDITISEPDYISISFNVQDVSCNGLSDGQIDADVTGGTSPYQYLWSNSDTTEISSNLSAISYTLSITDANGCIANNSVSVNQPDVISVISSSNTVSCYGSNDGDASIAISGGTQPYGILWSTIETTNSISNLYSGYYFYQISDSLNCIYTDSVFVDSPTQINITMTSTDVTCYGDNNGTALFEATGGTSSGNYGYSWSNGGLFEQITNLAPGNYFITVWDDNNCQAYNSVTISEPNSLSITYVTTIASCWACNDGAIDITVAGGIEPYSFDWDGGQTSEDISNIYAGYYNIDIFDANNCYLTQEIFVDFVDLVGKIDQNGDIQIYPNPASDGYFIISFDKLAQGSVIKLIDVSGKIVLEKTLTENKKVKIETNNLASGIYLIRINDSSKVYNRRVVIK